MKRDNQWHPVLVAAGFGKAIIVETERELDDAMLCGLVKVETARGERGCRYDAAEWNWNNGTPLIKIKGEIATADG